MARQVWESTIDGRTHRVETSGDFNRHLVWSIDGEQVAEKKSMEDKVTLKADAAAYAGSVLVRFTALGAPRRATLTTSEGLGELGIGGIDLAAEPGSPAALHHEKVLAHPVRYTAIATLAGVAKVVVPLLIVALLARFAVAIPWPDLPEIPWPEIPWPKIPWPDIPVIRLPDLPSIPWPEVTPPDWLAWLLEHAKYVWPVILAFVLARSELRRRRKHAAEVEAQRASRPSVEADRKPDDEGRTPKS